MTKAQLIDLISNLKDSVESLLPYAEAEKDRLDRGGGACEYMKIAQAVADAEEAVKAAIDAE